MRLLALSDRLRAILNQHAPLSTGTRLRDLWALHSVAHDLLQRVIRNLAAGNAPTLTEEPDSCCCAVELLARACRTTCH